jgi:hypothetical protein
VAAPNVKFNRIVKAGMKGNDVIALKIITSRAGCWPWAEFDNIAHPEFMNGKGKAKNTSGMKGLQRLLKVTADGVYGPATHKKSLPFRVPKGLMHAGEYIWDGHAGVLYSGANQPTVDGEKKVIVADIWKWWQWMIVNRARIHYAQQRPMGQLALHHEPPLLPFSEDCSATFIYCAFLGGAKSPDIANGFSGYGNTDSLIRCGQQISESQISAYCQTHYVGVIYGSSYYSTHHISAVKSPTQIASMGNENAPEWWNSIYQGPGRIAAIKAYDVV